MDLTGTGHKGMIRFMRLRIRTTMKFCPQKFGEVLD
jgi:hypothetical protein